MRTGQKEDQGRKRKIQMRNRTAGGQDWIRTGTGQIPEQEEEQDRMRSRIDGGRGGQDEYKYR